ncbi:MAG: DUF1549 and DUF1553 domain-containing protein [Prosthecobacter sp.]|uniref:DUF1549 and DUF1553 domain-containing protein n=1 Tax=Prosthecobacter sp. TaxID=1965333 RepID=UPI0025E54C92|nr:DUF1549 and DUF1553 domain-containing protein [Prosthecobacter sp.]MCF7784508.1 DUF1549 and DUF1553 domain-containing protein [Prosthecobacter sp.]
MHLTRLTLIAAFSAVVPSFAADAPRPLNFANDIVPILTKGGCNSGGCHGKSGGQNGFKLSLLGFEPQEDYDHIVMEARGRRVFPASAEQSLLLTKGTAQLPHGGGKKLDPNSEDYADLARWIREGMPYGKDSDPKMASISVEPAKLTMPLNAAQQLKVTAHYTDGSTRDVTKRALYEANEKAMAETSEAGRVQLFDLPGDVAVMVRYQGKVSTFRATVPLGAPVDTLPASRGFVDDLVFAKLKTIGMPPSDIADDGTFIRRVTLDITGRLPTAAEMKDFMASKEAAKRSVLIDRLLDSPEYAEYFANKWSALLRNQRTQPMYARGSYLFYSWIRDSIADNKPYDQFVREVVSATGDLDHNPPVAWYRQVKEMKQQMEDVAQLFLGTRMQCAQCHHHPFEKWSQQDYYGFAAFFSKVSRKPSNFATEELIFSKRGVAQTTNIRTKEAVTPTSLGGQALKLTPEQDPRQALGEWMSQKDNAFFAHTLVNRYWKHFFNRGLVEPEDDMRETNPPVNPELLSALAADFVKSGYDLKQLIRTITNSTTYQLSAIPNTYNAKDRQNFSRYYPKRLNAEVLYDSVNTLLDTQTSFAGQAPGTRAVALPDNSYNQSTYFLSVFGRPDSSSACECERTQEASLAQSLHLLNAAEIQTQLSRGNGRADTLTKDTRPDDDKIADLYHIALSRDPNAAEVKFAHTHLDKKTAGKTGDEAFKGKKEAYEDILWALLNTKEFLFNH